VPEGPAGVAVTVQVVAVAVGSETGVVASGPAAVLADGDETVADVVPSTMTVMTWTAVSGVGSSWNCVGPGSAWTGTPHCSRLPRTYA